MAKPITLIARMDFEHRGQCYTAGEELAVPAVDAVILLNRRVAAFPRREASTPPPDPAPPKRRRYRRKDMVPEE